MTHPSLGVIFHPKFPPETLLDYARRAESAGFDELWLWEDCFFAGAFTSAATILAATRKIKVGIGLMPAPVRNPLFAAMEITTLACLYPGRFLPGFGHGVDVWMKQIGAYPKSTLRALEETVHAVRDLMRGETVTIHGSHVHLENVKMELFPQQVPPIFVGGIREKSLRLAGRAGDGTILNEMTSPASLPAAREIIQAGMAETGRKENHITVYVYAKVNPNGSAARDLARQVIASHLLRSTPQLIPLGIAEQADKLIQEQGIPGAAKTMPEAWVDELSASGSPKQAAHMIHGLAEAGADSIVLEPIEGDPDSLDEYIRYLLPELS